jgi:gamma-tubulin complex component 3
LVDLEFKPAVEHSELSSAPQAPILSNSSPRKQKTTGVSEEEILHDLMYVFQGVDAKHISFDPITETYFVKLLKSKPMIELIHKLCELGWLYRRIAKYFDASRGLFEQSLVSAVKIEIQDYYRLVAIWTSQIGLEDIDDRQRLTLKRLYVWTMEPIQKLRITHVLLEMASSSFH